MSAKTIQVCGTGSGVGKSIIAAGLCRIFLQDGFKVAPFKAQNMALNSFVTKESGEIGRAQAVQAQACKIEPTVDMNPILIKPISDRKAQIIVKGKPLRNMSVYEYINYKKRASAIVLKSFQRLADEYELIVIEGAGSPAEINLRSHDIVNMKMAKLADAPVILVGDIDKGGVFAWLVGTLELLDNEERSQVKGFIINKFRGDKRLLKGGINFLERRTGLKALGVIPYFKDIRIPEEDSVPLEQRAKATKLINIAVIKLPHISNFTDFNALENEPDVRLSYLDNLDQLNSQDAIIIPGTKNTIEDLIWLKQTGFAKRILSTLYSLLSTNLIGICGGYQMLGQKIFDLDRIESRNRQIDGLNVLPIVTNFEKEKILAQVKAKEIISNLEVAGYEIHHGRTKYIKSYQPLFEIIERQGRKVKDFDGAISKNGTVWGTYIHGIFDKDIFRRDFLNRVRQKKGWSVVSKTTNFNLDKEFDKLAELLRKNIDMKLLYRILNAAL